MYLEIVSLDSFLFSSEVSSVIVPGIDGQFQVLYDHTPIVSILKKGTIKINTEEDVHLDENSSIFRVDGGDLIIKIEGGIFEMKNNKITILLDGV